MKKLLLTTFIWAFYKHAYRKSRRSVHFVTWAAAKHEAKLVIEKNPNRLLAELISLYN